MKDSIKREQSQMSLNSAERENSRTKCKVKIQTMLAVTDELPEGCTTVGEGTHLRFIVDKEKFISKLR